jgi:hypothetical protein
VEFRSGKHSFSEPSPKPPTVPRHYKPKPKPRKATPGSLKGGISFGEAQLSRTLPETTNPSQTLQTQPPRSRCPATNQLTLPPYGKYHPGVPPNARGTAFHPIRHVIVAGHAIHAFLEGKKDEIKSYPKAFHACSFVAGTFDDRLH